MNDQLAIQPADVLVFWRDAGRERWFEKDDAFDRAIAGRFNVTWVAASAGELASWEASDDGALALTIVLDQFPRNLFRNDPRAFASDGLARDVAKRAIARGADQRIERALRPFLYMPLMHSETLADQELCVALFAAHGDPDNLSYAKDHADIIRRFGRFPHRNRVLGRTTTADEQGFLDGGGFSG